MIRIVSLTVRVPTSLVYKLIVRTKERKGERCGSFTRSGLQHRGTDGGM